MLQLPHIVRRKTMSEVNKLKEAANNLGDTVKKAAMTGATVVSALGNMQAVQANEVTKDNELKDKIEVTVDKKAEQVLEGATADFVKEAEKLEDQKVDAENQLDDPEKSSEQQAKIDAVEELAAQIAENGKKTTLENIGVELSYDPEAKSYTLYGDGSSYIEISKQELNQAKLEREYNKKQKDKFSEPTKEVVQDVEISNQEGLNILSSGLQAYYSPENNTIGLIHIDVENDPVIQNRLKEGKISQEEYEAYKKEIDKVNALYESQRESTLVHERSHMSDDKLGAFNTVNLSPEQMAKINMFTEIKATMASAGLALEQFKQNGSLEGFDKLAAINAGTLKEALQKDPKKADDKKFIAETVMSLWLEQNNKDGSTYSKQAYNSAIGANGEKIYTSDSGNSLNSYSAASKVNASSVTDKNYQEIVNKMFKDVYGLGDVSTYINQDIKLNATLVKDINDAVGKDKNNSAFLDMVTQGSKTVKQATKKIANFFKQVEKVDKDGERTSDEKAKLDKKIGRKLWKLSGRIIGKKARKAIQSEQVNTNINIAQVQQNMQNDGR